MRINNILVTGRLYKDIQQLLYRYTTNKQFRFLSEHEVRKGDFEWADAYVGFRPTINFEFGNLKWVHSLGAGIDAFLFERRWKKDVLLTRTICSFGQKISEYCVSYILRDLQLHSVYAHDQKHKRWQPIEPKTLASQKVVIYGTGVIGGEVAKTLSLFGIKPIGVSLTGKAAPYFQQVVSSSSAARVLQEADWVITTLPLTAATHQFFNADYFQLLDRAGFINVGRGRTVDERALWGAVEAGNVRLAVLDVFEEEPLPEASPLWDHSRIIVTPHISAVTSPEEAVACFMNTLEKIEKGLCVPNKVDVQRGY